MNSFKTNKGTYTLIIFVALALISLGFMALAGPGPKDRYAIRVTSFTGNTTVPGQVYFYWETENVPESATFFLYRSRDKKKWRQLVQTHELSHLDQVAAGDYFYRLGIKLPYAPSRVYYYAVLPIKVL